jgi:hypothetical protein
VRANDARNVPAASTTAQVDPIVRDNLGHPVPVHTSELDVIETYLDQALQDLLALGEATVDRKEASCASWHALPRWSVGAIT